jgi:MmeI, target recognition domain/Eco57I restriction-modification methylase
VEWPKVDAIVGNPPFQSKNKMQQEFGRAYLNEVRDRYPDVPGRADYCVYWFRRAHDELADTKRAGLVGPNTIRQTYSREGGLDYIVGHNGTITEAVASQVWSGDAVVHVSIVNWIKGPCEGVKKLFVQVGNQTSSPWEIYELPEINSSLSHTTDVSQARPLRGNRKPKRCFQGQTHGHEAFLLPRLDAEGQILKHPELADIMFPYLTADDMLGDADSQPSRYVIDFQSKNLIEAAEYKTSFARIKKHVLPDRAKKAEGEQDRNEEATDVSEDADVNHHHANFLAHWWSLSYRRGDLIGEISKLPRYIVCGRVTKRPIFEFIHPTIHPNDALTVFTMPDDYSFGILQSGLHWQWFNERCSTLKADPRYTSNTVFDTFPWPQAPSEKQIRAVCEAAVALRLARRAIMKEHDLVSCPNGS